MKNNVVEKDIVLYSVMFATALVVANILAGKVIMIAGSIVLPAAVITYAFTFLFTDIIHEKHGKEYAQKAVVYGFGAQIFATIMIFIGGLLPVAPFATEAQTAYETLLGQNYRFVIASLAAYIISQNVDIYVFSKLKDMTKGKHKWLRNNVSTFSSQFLDTTIFITIAFIGTVPNIWIMVVSQFAVKVLLAVLDTPLFYFFTRALKTSENKNTTKSIQIES